jgi:6-phosphogluconolactonase
MDTIFKVSISLNIKEFNSEKDFVEQLVTFITQSAESSIKERGVFHIVLCGGRTPVPIYKTLSGINTNWLCWHFWLGDERMPSASAGQNSDLINETWISQVPVDPKKIHYIQVAAGMEAAVKQYTEALQEVDFFDLALLGVGEDGHTASLFPGNDHGQSELAADVLGIFNSPKEPKERISLSAARLSRSKEIVFIAQGEEKKNIINRIMQGDPLPCNVVKGELESLLYYLR